MTIRPYRTGWRMSVLLCGFLVAVACRDELPTPLEPDAQSSLLQDRGGPDRVRVILTLRDRSDQGAIAQAARGQGARILHQYRNFPFLALEVSRNALPGLLRSGRVESVAEDIATPLNLDSSIPVIRADQVHALGLDGSGYTVAILDTGIDRDHPFVAGRVVEEACYSSPTADQTSLCPLGQTGAGVASIDFAECWEGTEFLCGHGMFTAGIAAGAAGLPAPAPISGAAPGATIIAIRVFTRINGEEACDGHPACATTYESDQLAGLDRVYDLKDSYNIAAVNMSLGGGEFAANCDGIPVAAAIQTLFDAGIVTVVSSGNAGFPAAVGAPGCVSTAVTVGATDDADAIASFSNGGVLLDLFAPGVGITSSYDNDGWSTGSGTSASAPLVTGAWAVMRQAFPALTSNEILYRLQVTGVPITDGNGVTRSRIDLLAALAPGTIVIRKETSPAGRTGFGFTDDIAAPNAFTLAGGGSRTFSGILPGNYGVVEDDPGPFMPLTSIACTDPSGGSSVSLPDRTARIAAAPGETVTCTFTNTDLPPEVAAEPASQTLQYSDHLATITVSGRDSDQDEMTGSFTYRVGAGAFQPGLPPGLSATAGSCSTEARVKSCTWSLHGTLGAPEGTYTIRSTITDDDGNAVYRDVTVTVLPEDASVRFDSGNPVGVLVASPGGASGPFSLGLYVEEAEPDLAPGAAAPGDLSLAQISIDLVPVGPGGGAAGSCAQEGLSGTGYDQVLTIRCDFDVVPVNTYSVLVTIGGGYYVGAGEEVVTVYDPSLGFTSGGGWFPWPGTLERTSFGYTMKYNRKGQNPQGSLLLVRHLPDGSIYRIKSNALTSLAIGDEGAFGWASFTGKVTYQEPGWPEPLGGYEFVAYVEDRGEPGTEDRFWIAVRDRSGTPVVISSMPDPATGHAVSLGGGNISVPHGAR